MDKRGKMKGGTMLVIGAIAIVALFATGILSTDMLPTFSAADASDDGLVDSGCNTDPSIDITTVDSYNKGTSVTTTLTTYMGGVLLSDTTTPIADGVTKGGDFLVVANGSSYYSAMGTIDPVECGTDNMQLTLAPHGALTATFFNDAEQAGTAQAIGANEIKIVRLKLLGASEAAFGNPDSGVNIAIGFDYNTTQYDEIKSVTVNGAQLTETDIPRQSVGTDDQAFLLPVNSIANQGVVELYIEVDAATSVNPTSDIAYTVYDGELFFNDDGAPEWGWNDQDKADVGQANTEGNLDMS